MKPIKIVELGKNAQVASIRVHTEEIWDKYKRAASLFMFYTEYVLVFIYENESVVGGLN